MGRVPTGYDFSINHIKGKDNCPADSLSHVLVDNRENSSGNASFAEYTYLNFVSEEIQTAREYIAKRLKMIFYLKFYNISITNSLRS